MTGLGTRFAHFRVLACTRDAERSGNFRLGALRAGDVMSCLPVGGNWRKLTVDEFKRASNASPESEARGTTVAIDRKPLPKVDRLDYGMTMGRIVSIPLGGGLLCLLLTAIRAIAA